MKKLLVIVVLCLLLSGNGHAEKLDEYECYNSDGSGPAFFALADDYIINFYLKSNASKLKKINETEEKRKRISNRTNNGWASFYPYGLNFLKFFFKMI